MEALKIEKTIDCGCLVPHFLQKTVIDEDNLEKEIVKIMPEGVTVLFLSTNAKLKTRLLKLYPLETSFLENILQNDLAKSEIVFRDFEKVSSFDLPENIKMVISEGEFVALGKYISKKLGTRHVVYGGENFSSFDIVAKTNSLNNLYLDDDLFCAKKQIWDSQNADKIDFRSTVKGYKVSNLKNVDAVIAAYQQVNVPSGFAFVLSCFLALFDWDISALLFGKTICHTVFKKAQQIIKSLIDAVQIYTKNSLQLKKVIFDCQIKMASLIDGAGENMLISGASQAAAALAVLFKNEQRQLAGFFDTAFMFCPIVAKIYATFLNCRISFCPPPSNNFRAQIISEYLAINQLEALNSMPSYLDKKTIEITDYRLEVYKDELLRHIYSVIKVFELAYPMYFKLFNDDGFFLKDYFSSLDSSLAIGLACDVFNGHSLLNYIRCKGLLDRYII